MTAARRALALLVALLGLAVLTTPAGAANKPFSMTVSPGSVSPGQSTFAVRLTNLTGQQQLGSADITVPAAFTGVSVADPAGAPTATVSGNVVHLRNASVAPGASIDLSVTATVGASCTSATYTWSVIAKQANDFSGPPGNDLDLNTQASSLTTSVTGGCALRFVAGRQPADAGVDKTITSLDYQPGAPATQVEVIDGAGNRVTTSTASITLALGSSIGSGALHGTLTVSASGGVATFGNLSIDARGSYTLRATGTGLTAATSDAFRIDDVGVACTEDVTCTASLTNGDTTVAVTAPGNAGVDAGALILNNGGGFEINCADYDELTPSATFVEGPSRIKTVTATIDKHVMNQQPNNGASFLQMCFGAPYQFGTRPGSTLTGVDTDGDGVDDFFYGLLPDCGTPPCVSARNKTNAGDGVITTQAPGGSQDPAYRS